MDMLTKSLLTGAAVSALAAVPAMATVHMAGSNSNALVLHNGSHHSKTAVGSKTAPTTTYSNVTQTSSAFYTGNESTMYKKKVTLYPGGWYTYTPSGACSSIPGQKGTHSKDKNAKIKKKTVQVAVSTSHCHATVSQIEPIYKLHNNKISSDSFVFTVSKKKWTTTGGGHYNLKANYDYTITID